MRRMRRREMKRRESEKGCQYNKVHEDLQNVIRWRCRSWFWFIESCGGSGDGLGERKVFNCTEEV